MGACWPSSKVCKATRDKFVRLSEIFFKNRTVDFKTVFLMNP